VLGLGAAFGVLGKADRQACINWLKTGRPGVIGAGGAGRPGVVGAGSRLSENGVAGAQAASRAPGGVAGTLGPK
jgi:hypothetical protein